MSENSGTLYARCLALFDGGHYGPAITAHNENVRQMTLLMFEAGSVTRYLLLHFAHLELFKFHAWGSETDIDIRLDGTCTDPELVESVLARGIPFPRQTTMIGWAPDGVVKALVFFYNPKNEDPYYVVFLLSGTTDADWPPFIGQDFSDEIWRLLAAGSLVDMSRLVSTLPGAIFYVQTRRGTYIYTWQRIVGDGFTVEARSVFLVSDVAMAGQVGARASSLHRLPALQRQDLKHQIR